jgi:hypothetical protein
VLVRQRHAPTAHAVGYSLSLLRSYGSRRLEYTGRRPQHGILMEMADNE